MLALSIGVESLFNVCFSLNSLTTSYALGRGTEKVVPPIWEAINYSLFILGSVVVLGVLPAIVVFMNRERWAQRWFPESAAGTTTEGHVLYAVGYGLLGTHFIVLGLKTGVVALLQAAAESEYLVSSAWGSTGAAIVELAAGVFLLSSDRERVRGSVA